MVGNRHIFMSFLINASFGLAIGNMKYTYMLFQTNFILNLYAFFPGHILTIEGEGTSASAQLFTSMPPPPIFCTVEPPLTIKAHHFPGWAMRYHAYTPILNVTSVSVRSAHFQIIRPLQPGVSSAWKGLCSAPEQASPSENTLPLLNVHCLNFCFSYLR